MNPDANALASTAIDNTLKGLSPDGEAKSIARIAQLEDQAATEAAKVLLARLTLHIGDPFLALHTTMAPRLLQHLASCGLTSAEMIGLYPVEKLADAIRDKPRVLLDDEMSFSALLASRD